MKIFKKLYTLNLVLLISLLSSCKDSNDIKFISGTPKIDYLEGEFFTLEGLKINKEIKSITFKGNDIIEGQVIRGVGNNLPIYIRSNDNDLYQYKINVKEDKIDTSLEEFSFYELGRNGELHTSLTTLNPKMLVIPVEIKGFNRSANKINLNRIKKAFLNEDINDEEVVFESIKSYYKKSSFNKLDFDIKVVDEWFNLNLSPNEIYLKRSKDDPSGMGYVMNEAIKWYKDKYNSTCEEFDLDKDGFIDNVYLIYSAPNMNNYKYDNRYQDTYWAATTWNFLNYDKANIVSPIGYNFSLASYDFMDKGYGNDKIDTHTYIHETGHLLGLLDYYNYDSSDQASGAIDMMDLNIGDHLAMSKYSLKRIDPIVVNESSIIKLKPYSESGDFILIGGDNFLNTPFDEYFTIEYITPTNLNELDYLNSYNGYIEAKGYQKSGIRIYHCDNRGSDGKNYSKDPSKISINYVSNTPSMSRNYNSKFDFDSTMYNLTIMNKNYIHNDKYLDPLKYSYLPSDDALFFKDEEFIFNENSKYIDLMPSKSNKLNKYKEEPISSNILDFKVEIIDLSNKEATIKITINKD